jgi:glutathione synthase/RimK-type ligase-like ATP-grasp enzyme
MEQPSDSILRKDWGTPNEGTLHLPSGSKGYLKPAGTAVVTNAMKPYDVVLLTEDRYVEPREDDEYIRNIFLEDAILTRALEKRKIRSIRRSWSDATFDWQSTSHVVFRSTWDYFHRFYEFSRWLDDISLKTECINSADIVRWNMDKHYLNDLKVKGISVIETFFVEKGSRVSLKSLVRDLGWNETILKPVVSGGARHTYKIGKVNIDVHDKIFSDLIAEETVMLQPFQHHVVSQGEIGFIIIDGIYTHAVQKKARSGDFRVQDDFGGTVRSYVPSKEEIRFALHAVEACERFPLYARADVIRDNNNHLAISELELIEPELWFRKSQRAAELLAKGICRKLNQIR